MALPATDTFTGTTGVSIQSYSANWRANGGILNLNTNAVCPAQVSGEDGASWTADVFSNDQYSQGTIVAIVGAGSGIGVCVRANTSGTANYYGYYGNSSSNSGELHKTVSGSFSLIGAARPAFVLNDIVRLEVVGTVLSAKRNGALQGTTQSDSTFTSGSAGLCGFSNNTSIRIDDWEGGNIGGAAATSDPIYRRPMQHMLVR